MIPPRKRGMIRVATSKECGENYLICEWCIVKHPAVISRQGRHPQGGGGAEGGACSSAFLCSQI